jgi:hypothetical protein
MLAARIPSSRRNEVPVRKLQLYIDKYGPEAGRKLYHALQSQAAHAGVSARLRRKLQGLPAYRPRPVEATTEPTTLPLFPEPVAVGVEGSETTLTES